MTHGQCQDRYIASYNMLEEVLGVDHHEEHDCSPVHEGQWTSVFVQNVHDT